MDYRQDLNKRLDPIKPSKPTGLRHKVIVYTSRLESYLCGRISRATHIYGCVAWLSNPKILAAMRGKQGIVIVQSEDFSEYLVEQYRELTRHGLAIKQYGVPSFDTKNSKPIMHNKFILFAKTANSDGKWPKPEGVWTGSFNFTVNATYNLENAIYTNDHEAVKTYYEYLNEIVKSGDCHLI